MTFYFYDLETSGVNSREDRIMQFAGQRTDLNLKSVGKPDNFLIKMTEDILPEPEAILITGITPQQTLAEGITEAEAVKYLTNQVFTPGTIAVGFNNVRFDDEFIRYLNWRNFTDAYEWHWKDERSRWDILDLARITRALRPEGIKWPFATDGSPSNSLGLLTSVNKLKHSSVHDALSDVMASLAVAKLIKTKQPKLFEHQLNLRDKNKVGALVSGGQPFIYTSGRYPSQYEKTTVAVMIAAHPDRAAALVYDLRIDPNDFSGLTSVQLAKLWQLRGKEAPYFPVKKLSYNRCPAIAPLSVLDAKTATRLKLDSASIDKNIAKLHKAEDFTDKTLAALEIVEPPRQPQLIANEQTVDAQLYGSFVGGSDKTKMSVVRAADKQGLANLRLDFADERLKLLLPLYKARNFPSSLTADEQILWKEFKNRRLLDGGTNSILSRYFFKLGELSKEPNLKLAQKQLLKELNLYGQSIAPQ